jgi:hypothetical protein
MSRESGPAAHDDNDAFRRDAPHRLHPATPYPADPGAANAAADNTRADAADAAGAAPAVLQWGEAAAGRGRGLSEAVVGLGRDRRLVPLAVALGAVAAAASLIAEWQVTAIDGAAFDNDQIGDQRIAARVADVGGWGAGYLVGLALLAGALTLMLGGPPAGRGYARLTALSTGGGLLVMLAAVVADLHGTSKVLGLNALNLEQSQFAVEIGRGVWCGIVGVLAATLAAALAGRRLRAAGGAGDGRAADSATADGGAPPNLTVSPAAPFDPGRAWGPGGFSVPEQREPG